MRNSFNALVFVFGALFLADPVAAQAQATPPSAPRANVTSSTRLAWDATGAATLADAQAQSYFIVIDGVKSLAAATPVVCVNAVAPFACSMLFPALTAGDHTLLAIAALTVGPTRLESPASAPPLLVRMVVAPLSPSELRIQFNVATP